MNTIICSNCLYQGKVKTMVKGSLLMELGIWLCFFWIPLIPLAYSIWRLTTKEKVCPLCQSNNIIPSDSPRAKELFKHARKN